MDAPITLRRLAQDVARCEGRRVESPLHVDAECLDCLRRTSPPAGDHQVWTLPPAERPCPSRIADA